MKIAVIISRFLALIEVVILAVIALITGAVLLIFGLGGGGAFASIKDSVTTVTVLGISLGSMGGINVLRAYVREAKLPEEAVLIRDSILALVGASAATAVVVISGLTLTPEEQWVHGVDFVKPGLLLWVPLVHVALLSLSTRDSLTHVGADRDR